MAATTMQTELVLGLDEEPDRPIVLVAKDGSTRSVKYGVLLQSKMLAAALEDKDAVQVSVSGVFDEPTLARVVAYLEYHYNKPAPKPIPKPLTSIDMAEVCDYKWDAEFIDAAWNNDDTRNREIYLRLGEAANYLNIPPLLELFCAKLGAVMRGKDAEGILALFGVQSKKPEKRARTDAAQEEKQ